MIDMVRYKNSWMQIVLDDLKGYTEADQIRHFYPAGKITAQLAFPNYRDGLYIRFDPF